MRTALYPKQLTISLTTASYSQIKEISDEKQVSMADIIREVLDESLSNITNKNPEQNDLPFLINEK